METARTSQTQTKSEPTASATQSTSSTSSAMRASPLYAGPPAVRLNGTGGASAQSGLPGSVSELVSSPGNGEPLQPQVQSTLESSFKVDMSGVRVHTDARSSAVTDSISARAFTYGPRIFLGTGERASDLGLMAHEGAHVVQQQGSPIMQMSADTPATDTFEQEARSASLAVQQGQPFAVTSRTSEARVQKEDVPWWKRGLRAVASVASAGKDLLLKKAADWAKKIPGYDLLTVILGKDPITDQPVERNAMNLLRGIAGLIPGGMEMFDNLQKSGALQKAFDWFSQEITKLNLSWEMIKGLFRQFWDSLSASDILNPSGVLDRLGAIFGPPLKRLLDFALAGGKKILELIVEGALSLAGSFGKQVLALLQKGANAFSLIIKDPLGFLGNLLKAVKGGFQNFSNNIVKHLKTALFEWLFGVLQGAGLTLPDKFDLRGILSIILQVLGLTYARLRERLVKLIGEPAVAFIEKAFDFLKTIATQGISAAWQKLLEFATGLIDTVVEGIRNWVVTTIVRAAITKLVTMFNPVGAVIQGIITIYNTIAFFIERAKQIAALAEAIFDSIVNIANGNIGAATDHVEKAMARTLPVIISFLARLIGLGGISSEIKKIIQKIQSVIDNAINKVVNFIVDRAKGLIAKMTGKSTEAGKADTRTREAKEKDVKDAVRAVKESATSPGATIETVQQQLPKLKEIYRLNVLTVVPKSGSSFHIHAEVNPTGDEDVTIGGSKEPSAKIVGPLVVLQVTVMGRNYELKQSIQRHHYLWLDNADSEEINSIMFYNLPFDQIVKDSIELGKQIQTKLAKSQKAQVEGKYQVGERSYVVDNVEHFYVVQGKLVWGGVSKEEWLATRSIRKIHRGVKDDQGRLITYSTIRRMIARRRVRPDAQEAIRFIPRPNIVNAAVIAFKAAPSSDRKIIEASGQEQLALAIRFLVQND